MKQVGTPEEIFFSPSSPEVTLFVGMENIFPGEIRREGDKKYFYLGQKAVETKDGFEGKGNLGIRPEHVILVEKEENNCLWGKIVSAVPRGVWIKLTVDVGFPLKVLLSSQEGKSFSPGQRVCCFLPPEHLCIFPVKK